jgi:hypothetical protein
MNGAGLGVLGLTTTDRKSGVPRSVMFTSPLQEARFWSWRHPAVAMTIHPGGCSTCGTTPKSR